MKKYQVLCRRRSNGYTPVREIWFYEGYETTGMLNGEAYIQLVFFDGQVPVKMEFYNVHILEMTDRIRDAIGIVKSKTRKDRRITAIWNDLKVQVEISNMKVMNLRKLEEGKEGELYE